MENQKIITDQIYTAFHRILNESGLSSIFLVCGKNVSETSMGKLFVSDKNISVVFQDFLPNPSFESVKEAVYLFRTRKCDGILAIGGGSAMDVAKCVKAFVSMNPDEDYFKQEIEDNAIPYYAIPTTAGTGSEATQFATIYVDGEKKSVESPFLKPEVIFMDSSVLSTLPLFQKKATMLDALCHSIESFWSVNATQESRGYAEKSLNMILKNYQLYLDGDKRAENIMLFASYYAGKAINISKTTAAHAMCYKLTKLYNLPHGLAAGICLCEVWEYTWLMAQLNHDKRLLECMQTIADIWGCATVEEVICQYRKFLEGLNLNLEIQGDFENLEILIQSVNVDRLENHPVLFSRDIIQKIYTNILIGRNKNAD